MTLNGEQQQNQEVIQMGMKRSYETANTLKIAMDTANAIEQRAVQIKQELERAQYAMKPLRENNLIEQRSMNPMLESSLQGSIGQQPGSYQQLQYNGQNSHAQNSMQMRPGYLQGGDSAPMQTNYAMAMNLKNQRESR